MKKYDNYTTGEYIFNNKQNKYIFSKNNNTNIMIYKLDNLY